MSFRLSIIVPTCGRPTLENTLRSISEQKLEEGDEVLVVTDGPRPLAASLFRAFALRGCCVETKASGDYGGRQRNRGMDLARGDYLLFMDDDDIYEADALATIRAALHEAPNRPHLFRMRYAWTGRVLWAERTVRLGNISTQMIAFPNRRRLRRWDSQHGHDFRFVENNLPHWPPHSLVWREEIIAVIRPATHACTRATPEPEPRPVEQCTFREVVPGQARKKIARCRLLQQISGVDDPGWCRVRHDACEACCVSFRPSPIDMNPVIASLLYGLGEEILARQGVEGCSPEQAAGLQAWAERHLEVERGDSAPPDFAQSLACRPSVGRETARKQVPVALPQLLPIPRRRFGGKVRRWAVGITTAPRRQATLDFCLESVIRAGWPRPHLFMDSRVPRAESFADLPVTLRESKVGAWPSYYLAVLELLMREPRADALLLIQDDVVLYDDAGLREYLEQILWPADNAGALSLFCSTAYTQPRAGWYVQAEPWIWGAQAFVFSRQSAKRFLTDPLVLEHRWSQHNAGLANIDIVIGQWAWRQGLAVCYPTPSLAQHLGHTSTLWPHAKIAGYRKADRFAGDL
jgi:hypothetical protein